MSNLDEAHKFINDFSFSTTIGGFSEIVISKPNAKRAAKKATTKWYYPVKNEYPPQNVYKIGSYGNGEKSFLCRYSNDETEEGWLNRDGDYISAPTVWCDFPSF